MTEWLSASEAARRAQAQGVSLSHSGVLHWMNIGAVSVTTKGRRRLVSAAEVLAKATDPSRRPSGRRERPPVGRISPSERIARVATMYADGLTSYQIAGSLGFSQAAIAKDVKALGIGRIAAPPRKYEKPEERECARDGCTNRFTPDAHLVAKGHGLFCSRPCAAKAQARPRTAGSMRTCKNPKCRKEFWVWDAHTRRGDKKFGGYCSRECAGRGKWVVDSGAGARSLAESLKERGLWSGHAGSVWGGRWADQRAAKIAGIEAGRAKGGRPPKISADQAVQILELDKSGMSATKIADVVFGDARFRKRVDRFLSR